MTAVIEWVLIVALAGSVIWLIVRDHRREMAALADLPQVVITVTDETPIYTELAVAHLRRDLDKWGAR